MSKARMAAAALGIALGAVMVGAATAQTASSNEAGTLEPEFQESWKAYLAMKAKARPPHIPDWSGVWRRQASGPAGIFSFGTMSPEDIAALLTPKFRTDFEDKKRRIAAGQEWDRLSDCLPVGMPRWLTEPFLREFIATPKETWLIHQQITEVRRIFTNGELHEPRGKTGPIWEGDSVGFWDGDTLVIHSIRVKGGEYQRGEPNTSFKLSTVERMRSLDANTIETIVTVYDPASLTKPFTTRFVYGRERDRNARIQFESCEEGNNAVRAPDGGTTFVLPGEPGYHDPQTRGIPDVARESRPQ